MAIIGLDFIHEANIIIIYLLGHRSLRLVTMVVKIGRCFRIMRLRKQTAKSLLSLVLLVLILACLARRPSSTSDADANADAPTTTATTETTAANTNTTHKSTKALQAVYVVAPNSFTQVDEFVASSAAAYHLDVTSIALPMRAALGAYLEVQPAVKAIFVGTRRTDPHGAKLGHFDATDSGWPDFMRIHPVVDWHYTEIWAVSCVSLISRCVLGRSCFANSR